MVRLNPKQRGALADAVRQLRNLVIGGLVVGQVVASQPLSWPLLLAGIGMWMASVGAALFLLAGEDT